MDSAYTIVNHRMQARHIQELETTMRSIVNVGMDVHKETIAIAVFRDNNRNGKNRKTGMEEKKEEMSSQPALKNRDGA